MLYFYLKIFLKYCMSLRNFKKQGGWASTSNPRCLETAKTLSLPHGSSTYISSQEGHIPAKTPEQENDPKGCETRPSIYYSPKFICKAMTQLVKKHYPHSTTLLFLCFYVGHRTEKSLENLPGKIWKLQLRIADPTFLLKLFHERKGEVTRNRKLHLPKFYDFVNVKIFLKN